MIILYIIGVLVALFLVYVLFLGICSLFVNPKKEYDKDSGFYRFLLNSATAMMLKILRIRVHVEGKEKVSKDVKPLFVGNHLSNYDPIISWYIFREWKPAFISKEANFKIPFFGRFIRKCCFMVIDRENPRNALKTISKAADLLKQQEVSVGVYPEGTRSKSGELLPFHNGVFKIAQKADKPIVVLQIRGTNSIYKNIPFKHSDVYIKVVDIIEADEVKELRSDAIGERVRKALMEGEIDG